MYISPMAGKSKLLGGYQPEYEYVDLIGKGSMGSVSLYHDPYLDRALVIKTMHRELLNAPMMYQRFTREVQILSYLNHPNIVDVYGFWFKDDMVHLSMEHVNGWNLRQVIEANPNPPVWVACGILWQVIAALEYAHGTYAHKHLGPIMHRDLKPSNIVLGFNGRLKVLDFGISKGFQSNLNADLMSPSNAMDRDPGLDLTQEGAAMGTAAYMSPEQAQALDLTPATDIFSIGTMTWEMLTGKHPFRANNEIASMQNIVHKELNTKEFPSTVPPFLRNLVFRMLSKDPKERPTAQECLKTLDENLTSYSRNWEPNLGHYLLHVRKPEKHPPPPEPLLQRAAAKLPWQAIAAGCAAGFVVGILIGKLA